MRALQTLVLRGASLVDGDGVSGMAAALPGLRVLRLDANHLSGLTAVRCGGRRGAEGERQRALLFSGRASASAVVYVDCMRHF